MADGSMAPNPNTTPAPPAPVEPRPDGSNSLYALWLRVQEALQALPLYFDSKTTIEGIEAGDLFSLNSVLGSTIEVQVVSALNRIRDTWDPPHPGSMVGDYAQYGFVRMPQSYPDVRLQRAGDPNDVLLGLELKGWYLLSKEEEPSYRFKATPLAASEWDLLVVVPWYLHHVLSGRPAVLEPFVKPARWAAEVRNWHWEWIRRNPRRQPQNTRGVNLATGVTAPPPYPSGKTEMSDKPKKDDGDNFGRLSRAGVMDEYIARLLSANVSGIAARDWIAFFTIFTESSGRDRITSELRKMEAAHAALGSSDPTALRVVELARALLAAVGAARSGDDDDALTTKEALRGAVKDRREELEALIRAAASSGVDKRELAKLAGVTPARLRRILPDDGREAVAADEPDDSAPMGDIGG